ncbi:MAG: hypothetical protein ACD_78C00274G0011 [uncultured bacterium (gcode 4)]|uniref:Uncharacterized protein n=1 Tax=uncultured bacterium (gcode 4) TaxID=1234023 RepID=K1YWV2_9BACT|nr:MAG: hypothetical protein ACD_78C00274G0011 [uncultured bacterium (gcode 4)]
MRFSFSASKKSGNSNSSRINFFIEARLLSSNIAIISCSFCNQKCIFYVGVMNHHSAVNIYVFRVFKGLSLWRPFEDYLKHPLNTPLWSSLCRGLSRYFRSNDEDIDMYAVFWVLGTFFQNISSISLNYFSCIRTLILTSECSMSWMRFINVRMSEIFSWSITLVLVTLSQ